jgi:BioD-like phosphotransacetylase family protein
MNTPRTRLRITAYHMVVASSVPWMRSHGRGGGATSSVTPASMS